jgi:DNA invertase Pin-like site-specific DNA recombinase
MDKVVILARVSTDKQEYRRQVNELKSFCQKMDWEIIGTFTNKISGAESLENRKELIEMIKFVRSNDVQRVVCLEISRLGRNTLEALKVIQILNENKVSLYIKNYSLETLNSDRSINPVASLICTILLEIASMERLTIRERMNSGRAQYIEKCRREGIKMGRPSSYKKDLESYKQQYQKEIVMLKKGISLRNISTLTGTSVNTIRKVKELCLTESDI